MSARGPRINRSVQAWDPVRDLFSLKDRLNRLFENLHHNGEFAEGEITGWVPAADLREDDEGFLLIVELPGVRREDVQVRMEHGILTLEGHRLPDPDARDADHLRVERVHGPFMRKFTIPGPVDEGRIAARMDRGVLEILLPRATESHPGPVKIRVS